MPLGAETGSGKKGAYVVLGGLHVTSLPEEATRHADSIFLGPGEDTWPKFLKDYRAGKPEKIYFSQIRTLIGLPKVRRDLIKRELYFVPNSIVVSRGCPHKCDFCYKEVFLRAGNRFTHNVLIMYLQKSKNFPGSIFIFLMTIFSGMCLFQRRCLKE